MFRLHSESHDSDGITPPQSHQRLLQQNRHIAAQNQFGPMSAAGESCAACCITGASVGQSTETCLVTRRQSGGQRLLGVQDLTRRPPIEPSQCGLFQAEPLDLRRTVGRGGSFGASYLNWNCRVRRRSPRAWRQALSTRRWAVPSSRCPRVVQWLAGRKVRCVGVTRQSQPRPEPGRPRCGRIA
jgi:hypothetical protein